ncbi:MAG: hypothetical protein ACR2NN_16890 [Bryobacteraceae bacterium]
MTGLLAGFAYAIKYTAGVSVVFALGFVLSKSASIRRTAVICGSSVIMIAPWMIKNWVIVANPFSPLMNRWFPNPYVSAGFGVQTRYLLPAFLLGPSRLDLR